MCDESCGINQPCYNYCTGCMVDNNRPIYRIWSIGNLSISLFFVTFMTQCNVRKWFCSVINISATIISHWFIQATNIYTELAIYSDFMVWRALALSDFTWVIPANCDSHIPTKGGFLWTNQDKTTTLYTLTYWKQQKKNVLGSSTTT